MDSKHKDAVMHRSVCFALSILLASISGPSVGGNRAWTSIQPFGGTTEDFASASDVLFANSIRSDWPLYRSDDGGATWTRVLVDPVVSLASSPHDAEMVFAGGTREILVTTNAGDSWQTRALPGTFPDFRGNVVSIAFDADADVVYAAVDAMGVYVSTDGGTTWVQSPSPSTDVLVVAADPAAPGTVFAGVFGDRVHKSTDGGATWTATTLTATSIGTLLVHSGRVFAGSIESDKVFRSLDGGANWTEVTSLPTAGSGLTPSDIAAGTAAGEYFVTYDSPSAHSSPTRAFRTLDGGDNWSVLARLLPDGGNPEISAIHVDQDTPGKLIVGSRFGNFTSPDSGGSWAWTSDGLDGATVSSFMAGPESGRIVAGSRQGGVIVSDDAGGTWSIRNDGVSNGDVMSVATAADVIIAGHFERILRSVDRGASWTVEVSGANGFVDAAIDPLDAANVYVLDEGNDGIWLSTDGGENFSFAAVGLDVEENSVIGISAADPTVLYVNNASGVQRSDDSGASWASAMGNLAATAALTVAVHPDDANIVYATFADGTFRTDDGGENWNQVWSGTPVGDGAALRIAFAPSNPARMLVATATGMHGSVDGGAAWVPVDDGYAADPTVLELAFDPGNQRRYLAATGSRTDGRLQSYSGSIAVDLSASATGPSGSITVGSSTTVSWTVQNLSGDRAEDAGVTVSFPANFSVGEFAFDGADCVLSNRTLSCDVDRLNVGDSMDGTATISADSAGSGNFRVTIASSEADLDDDNDSRTVTLTAAAAGSGGSGGGGGGGHGGWLMLLAPALLYGHRRRV